MMISPRRSGRAALTAIFVSVEENKGHWSRTVRRGSEWLSSGRASRRASRTLFESTLKQRILVYKCESLRHNLRKNDRSRKTKNIQQTLIFAQTLPLPHTVSGQYGQLERFRLQELVMPRKVIGEGQASESSTGEAEVAVAAGAEAPCTGSSDSATARGI
eukprot:768681-Hanusia_phi.AAC.15